MSAVVFVVIFVVVELDAVVVVELDAVAVVVFDPRKLPLKFGLNWVRNRILMAVSVNNAVVDSIHLTFKVWQKMGQ